jgi:hypothetical protein
MLATPGGLDFAGSLRYGRRSRQTGGTTMKPQLRQTKGSNIGGAVDPPAVAHAVVEGAAA